MEIGAYFPLEIALRGTAKKDKKKIKK